MPLYEYKCAKCKEVFEVLRPMQERDEPVPCPECGSPDPARILSPFATASGSSGLPSCADSCTSGFT